MARSRKGWVGKDDEGEKGKGGKESRSVARRHREARQQRQEKGTHTQRSPRNQTPGGSWSCSSTFELNQHYSGMQTLCILLSFHV